MPASKPMLEDLQVSFVETYTPGAGAIVSPLTLKTLEYAFFMVSEDANITVQCYGDNSGGTQVIAVKGGVPYPFAVKRITALSTGTVYILHNNK